jgi:predicted membrane protein
MVVGNFERALLGFHEQRLVTEGVILVNAVVLTLLLLLGVSGDRPVEPIPAVSGPYAIRKAIVVSVVAMTIGVLLDFAIVRAIHGDRFAGHAGYHNRFDPKAKAP